MILFFVQNETCGQSFNPSFLVFVAFLVILLGVLWITGAFVELCNEIYLCDLQNRWIIPWIKSG